MKECKLKIKVYALLTELLYVKVSKWREGGCGGFMSLEFSLQITSIIFVFLKYLGVSSQS